MEGLKTLMMNEKRTFSSTIDVLKPPINSTHFCQNEIPANIVESYAVAEQSTNMS